MDRGLSEAEMAQQHRAHLRTKGGVAAFDAMTRIAAGLKGYRVYPARHGDSRVFQFDDVRTRERPFAFIVNRSDLLFYVRKPGFARVPRGFEALRRAFETAKQNSTGEWTVRLTNATDVENLAHLLFQDRSPASCGEPWSAEEIAVVVEDYLEMLVLEQNGQSYNKAARARALMAKLAGRSRPAVEMKRQNISAILCGLNAPYIPVYKPLGHVQQALFDSVAERLNSHPLFDASAVSAVERPASLPPTPDFSRWLVESPRLGDVKEPKVTHDVRVAVKRDYFALESHNRSLGRAGELLVVEYERRRLRELGAVRLSERVEHVAEKRGDGLGYDVLSFETNGKERLIEVKTTSFGREVPFFVSRNELNLSKDQPDLFRLCRVFDLRRRPQMFELRGALDKSCLLDPISYRASFR